MAKSFVKPWARLVSPGESVGPLVPAVDLIFIAGDGSLRLESFLIDSGADISMAPRHLCKELGLDWETGDPILHAPLNCCPLRFRLYKPIRSQPFWPTLP